MKREAQVSFENTKFKEKAPDVIKKLEEHATQKKEALRNYEIAIREQRQKLEALDKNDEQKLSSTTNKASSSTTTSTTASNETEVSSTASTSSASNASSAVNFTPNDENTSSSLSTHLSGMPHSTFFKTVVDKNKYMFG